MSTMASKITGVSVVCSTVCSDADQRKPQSSVSLACVRGIHRWIPLTKGQWRWKCFHLMTFIVFITQGMKRKELIFYFKICFYDANFATFRFRYQIVNLPWWQNGAINMCITIASQYDLMHDDTTSLPNECSLIDNERLTGAISIIRNTKRSVIIWNRKFVFKRD